MSIAIYDGKGTWFKDLFSVLRYFNIKYDKLNSSDIKTGKLKKYKLLIIPGGWSESFSKYLGNKGFEKIREFVREGGNYLGICAGAYLAPNTIVYPYAKQEKGLGIIDVENIRLTKKDYAKERQIVIVTKESAILKNCPKQFKCYWDNGPSIRPGKKIKVLAKYEDGSAAIVFSNYLKGNVILISPHLEEDLRSKILFQKFKTYNIIKILIDFMKQKKLS